MIHELIVFRFIDIEMCKNSPNYEKNIENKLKH